ncbi:MAG: hypothetical protein AB7U73_17615 [Pirellulales bacterium]
MPFTKCKRCGRLFHLFDPNLAESSDGYWPNLKLGDAAKELCPECLEDEKEDLGPEQPIDSSPER